MKRFSFWTAAIFIGSFGAFAQSPSLAGGPPPGRGFGGPGPGPMAMGVGGMHQSKVVTGAPYSADVNTSSAQTLPDGNTISRTNTGHVARDAQGRTYVQQSIGGGPWAQKGPTTITFISDPVAGYTYVLNPNTKIAMRRVFKPRTGEPPTHPMRNFPSEASKPVETELGQQSINGLTATGKSITHTIPAGEIGNSQPIVDKSEIWTSPDLQVVVLSKRIDPRFGNSTYTLNNIRRGEPNAALFQVPSDYTVQDAPAREFPR